jgi:aspartate kinase
VIVLEFGGTFITDLAAIDRATSITRSHLRSGPVVVVSALAGTTAALLKAALDAARGDRAVALEALRTVGERHLAVVEMLVRRDPTADETGWEVDHICDSLVGLMEALVVLGHVTPRGLDTIVAYGAQLSARIVVAAFRAADIPAVLVDARQIVVTDSRFTRAGPLPTMIESAAKGVLRRLVEAGRVPVLGGGIGATADGATTTLWHGGSDLSASLIGAALDAEAIEIWTDVDNMLTADPRAT